MTLDEKIEKIASALDKLDAEVLRRPGGKPSKKDRFLKMTLEAEMYQLSKDRANSAKGTSTQLEDDV